MSLKGYTVFAVYEDDIDQRYTQYIEAAKTPEDAEKQAVRKAPHSIVVAAVVEGRIPVVGRSADEGVVPIRGRGYATTVAQVSVTYVPHRFPFSCPGCKGDLRKPSSLYQWDLVEHVWHARVPRGAYPAARGHVGAALNEDVGARQPINQASRAVSVIVQCAKCKYPLWNGLKGSDVARL